MMSLHKKVAEEIFWNVELSGYTVKIISWSLVKTVLFYLNRWTYAVFAVHVLNNINPKDTLSKWDKFDFI